MRMVLWFHHIKAISKRKDILNWAHELDIRGFSKPGFPGIIIFEGSAGNAQVKGVLSKSAGNCLFPKGSGESKYWYLAWQMIAQPTGCQI